MEQDILSIGFDYKRTQADAEKVLSSMQAVLDQADKLSSLKEIISTGSNGFAASKKGAEELTRVLKDQNRVIEDYNRKVATTVTTTEKVIGAYDKLKKQYIDATKEAKNLAAEFGVGSEQALKAAESAGIYKAKLDEINKASKQPISAPEIPFTHNLSSDGTIIEPTQGKAAGAIVSDVERLQVEGILTAKEYAAAQRGVSSSFVEINKTAKSYAVTQKEIDLALAQDKYLAQQNAAALKNQIREEINVKGSLEQRRAALIRLTRTYDQLSAAERGSGYGQRLQTTIGGLTNQVKVLEEATGRSQRSVGGYGNAITKAFSGAFSFIRQIAYVLPGIGIAGILGGISDVVIDLVSALMKGKDELNTFAENYKNVIDVVANANKSAGKQIADLEILYSAATNVNNSIGDRKAAVHALKEEFPDYFGKINDEIILNGKSKDAYDALKASIISASRATAAKAKIDDIERQKLDSEFQKQKIKTATDNESAGAAAKIAAQVNVDEFGRQTKVQGELQYVQSAINQRRVKALRDEDKKQQSLDQQEKFLINFVGEKNITKVVVDENTKRAKSTKAKDVKDISDAVTELRKELAKIQSNFDIGQITGDQADLDRVKAYQKAFDEIFKRGGNVKAPIVQQLGVELSPISIRIMEAQIKEFAQRVQSDNKIEIPIDTDEARRNLIIKNTSDAVQKIVDSNDKLYAKDLENLNKSLIAKGITQEDYNKAVEQLQKDHVRTEISNSIELNQALIDNLKARGFDVTKFEEKLNEQKQKLYEFDAKAAIEADNKKKKSAEDLAKAKNFFHEKEIQLGKELASLGSTLVEASIENQKNKLQELEDLQQKNYENQVQRINSSTLTDAQKADQLTVLEKQRQAQKDKNEREQKDLDIKKAKFERLIAAANIVAATATAEVQALTYLSNPFTAPLYPGIAATIAAIGAVQLAALLATPIPKYATGTSDHPGGWAEVGEGQYKELVEMPGGHSFIADRAMVMDLPQHTKVTPITNDDINKMLYKGMMAQTAANIQSKPDKSERILLDIHRELKKNNGKKVQFNAHIKYDTTWDSYKKKYYS